MAALPHADSAPRADAARAGTSRWQTSCHTRGIANGRCRGVRVSEIRMDTQVGS